MRRLVLLLPLFIATCAYCSEKVYIVKSPNAAPRVSFGIDKLNTALKNAGYKVVISKADKIPRNRPLIIAGTQEKNLLVDFNGIASEGFVLESKKDITIIAGGDDSGTLYGCMELAERIKKVGALPADFRFADKPAMTLRGTCIGMQKNTTSARTGEL